MKIASVADIKARLSSYLKASATGPVVVTRNGKAVAAYSPFGHGNFPETRSTGGKLLQQIAQEHGATPRQVALSFLLRNARVFTIPKSSNVDHVEENAAAGDSQHSGAELKRIERAFARGRRPKSLPML